MIPPLVCRICFGTGADELGAVCVCRTCSTLPAKVDDGKGRSFKARAGRGRPLVTLSMAQSSRERLRALAGERGVSLGDAVELLLNAWDERDA